jgi:hypothetical protein
MICQAAENVMTEEGVLGPKGAEEAEAVRAVVAALMHELECILHEYLSYNWDRWARFSNPVMPIHIPFIPENLPRRGHVLAAQMQQLKCAQD